MNCQEVMNKYKGILLVRTTSEFKKDATIGFLVAQKNLDNRKNDVIGRVIGYVPGCGGDVWWVNHQDDSVGPYVYDEFEEVSNDEYIKLQKGKNDE